jgi:RNA polymerase sigma-32 factor
MTPRPRPSTEAPELLASGFGRRNRAASFSKRARRSAGQRIILDRRHAGTALDGEKPREHAPIRVNDKRKRQPKPKPAAARTDTEPEEGQAEEPEEGDDFEPGDDEVLEATAEVVEDEPVSTEVSGSSLARYDALQVYMREVQRHPLLTPDEEHKLAVEYSKTGDVAMAARLVTANLRLVVKLAYEYRRAYRNMMDLIQEGNIGLMQAVKRYDPYRGVKLSSYSAWWIRAYMLRFILNNWRLVKLGTTQAQRKLFFNLSKEKAKLSAMGIEPTAEEIAKRLDVAESEVIEMDRRLASSDASLDTPVRQGDGRETTRLELMPALDQAPDQAVEDSELQHLLRERLEEFRKTLQGKDVAIFEKRLIADEPLTLQELGDEFGVSRERVRQLEARLSGRLRDYLQQTLGDGS